MATRSRRQEHDDEDDDDSNLVEYGGMDPDAMDEIDDEVDAASQSKFVKLKQGKNVLRFLPRLKGQKSHVKIVHQHFWPTPDGKIRVACAKLMSKGKERCLLCEEADHMEQHGNHVDKQRAQKLRPEMKVYANVIDRAYPEQGPKILQVGKSIWKQLKSIFDDDGDYTDPTENGFDIIIRRTGEEKSTRYEVKAARNNSPLGDISVIAQQHDLTEYALLPSRKDQKAIMSGDRDAVPRSRQLGSGEDDDDDDTPRRGRRRTVEDDLEDGTVIDVTRESKRKNVRPARDEDEDDVPL